MLVTIEVFEGRKSLAVMAEVRFELIEETPDSWDVPGTPASVFVNSVHVTEVIGADFAVQRHERPDWFAWLDEVAARNVNPDSVLSEVA